MKAKNKNKMVSALAFAATACMAFSFVLMKNVSADAETINEAEKTAFFVENGASVRTTAGTSGIRFTTRISKAYYDSVKDSEPTWGTVVGYEVEDAETLTIAAAKADENDGIYLFAPKTALGNPTAIQPKLSEDGTYYYYNTVIIYNNLESQSEFDYACNVKINVRSYVTCGENTVYSYVDENTDTYRSITEVAEKVLVNDAIGDQFYEDDENEAVQQAKDVLKKYINAKVFPQTVSDKLAYSYDMADTGDKLTGVDVADGEYKLIIDNVDMGDVTVTGGELTLNGNFPSSLTLGEKYTVVLKNASTTTVQAFKYVSKTVSTTEEFNAMVQTYSNTDAKPTTPQKYYVLTNDIGSSSYTTPDGTKLCFYDVFDGQGHTLTVGTTLKSIFGYTNGKQSEAIIKNLAIRIMNVVEPNNSTSTSVNIFGFDMRKATIENVSVAYTPWGVRQQLLLPFGFYLDGIKLKDVYLYYSDNVQLYPDEKMSGSTVLGRWGYIGGCMGNSAETFNQKGNAIYTVSKYHKVAGFSTTYDANTHKIYCAENESEEVKTAIKNYVALRYSDIDGVVTGLKNIYRYDTVAAMAEAGVTKVGDWVINADGTTTWAPEADGFVPAYAETENTVSIDKTEHNLVNAYETEAEEDTETYVFSGTLAVPVEGITAGEYAVTVNGVPVEGAVVEDNLVTFPIANATMTLGGVNTLEAGGHVQPFRYITKVLTTADELKKALHVYEKTQSSIERQRYYVLGNDIAISTLFDPKEKTNDNYKFFDVFDGAGYTIKVGTMTKAGLFGMLGNGAVVKDFCLNVTYVIGPNNTSTATSMLASEIAGTTIKNVALIFDTNVPKAFRYNFIAYKIDANTVMEDVYAWIDPETTLDPQFNGTNVSGGVGYIGGANTRNVAWTTNVKNVYYVAPFADAIHENEIYYASNEVVEEGAKKLANVYRYATAEAMANAGVTQVGNWKINKATGTVTFDANSYVSNDGKSSNGSLGGSSSESVLMAIEQTLALEEGASARSGNETIVKVSGGKLIAVGVGKTTVSVTKGNNTRVVYVVVEDPTKDSTVENITLTVGDSTAITVKTSSRVEYKAFRIVSGGEEFVSLSGDALTALKEGVATVQVAFQIKGVVKVVDVTVTVNAAAETA